MCFYSLSLLFLNSVIKLDLPIDRYIGYYSSFLVLFTIIILLLNILYVVYNKSFIEISIVDLLLIGYVATKILLYYINTQIYNNVSVVYYYAVYLSIYLTTRIHNKYNRVTVKIIPTVLFYIIIIHVTYCIYQYLINKDIIGCFSNVNTNICFLIINIPIILVLYVIVKNNISRCIILTIIIMSSVIILFSFCRTAYLVLLSWLFIIYIASLLSKIAFENKRCNS